MRHAVATSILAVSSPAAYAALAALDRRGPAQGSRGAGDEPYQFFRVLYDNVSAEGSSFGAEAAARGAAARGVGVDLGGIWLHEIEPRWKHGPAAIAGLTTGPHLFCLELLARDYGMGVVYRTRHARTAERSWARAAAVTAMTCPVSARPDARIDLVDLADDSRIAEAPLYSWVIAPANGGPALAVRR
jgi:hypothetical protein